MSITYCKKCLMPNSKPYLTFDKNGVCSACIAHEQKSALKNTNPIDWKKREEEFEELVSWVKEQNAPYYDVMVPVSGGKDSITQVHRLLNKGLRILAVNIDYGIKTELGKYNLERIPLMGANLTIFRPELGLHKKLIKIGLEEYGDPDLLSHTLLHAYPLHVAMQFQIPLCLLGENSAFEYGGDPELANKNYITKEYFEHYAANKGMTAKVVAEKYGIDYKFLWKYDFPNEIENNPKIKAIFASYYFPWDSNEHLKIAQEYGFKQLEEAKEGTYRKFVGVDEQINRLHQYIKVLKFGYGRATDHACEDIRLGLLSRDEAKKLVKQYDLQPLGEQYINEICDFLDYDIDEFLKILENYRNQDIWKQNDKGEWTLLNHLED